MTDELRHVNLDARQIRVLAHPLRSRLVGQLRVGGPATATQLAAVFRTNTGATSYHLRQLAEVGLVVEEPSGRGRQRWWRAAHDVSSWERDGFPDDPDAQAAADWLTSNFARNLAERVQDWLIATPTEPEAWRLAAQFSDYILRLNATQLTAMTAELDEVVERWRRQTTAAPAEDARTVLLYLYPVPLPQPDNGAGSDGGTDPDAGLGTES
ncbi:ArsR/SmtB family transcription factor [Mangrovihabitans endophyticus]|uniref:Transcriptional regulator n=1 Tax=Mangrovihabitans endophyticus TaxID=1751298 RepID=A0A8J3C6W2_9ACTN|nr:helix-turn-helix domain-containing protein [Mangrovihabitans endophyticus]GGL13546.1 transcriptional regulator [Mangrovihabitans endophyticus]